MKPLSPRLGVRTALEESSYVFVWLLFKNLCVFIYFWLHLVFVGALQGSAGYGMCFSSCDLWAPEEVPCTAKCKGSCVLQKKPVSLQPRESMRCIRTQCGQKNDNNTEAHRWQEGPVTIKAGTAITPSPGEACLGRRSWKRQGRFSSRAFQGSVALLTS